MSSLKDRIAMFSKKPEESTRPPSLPKPTDGSETRRPSISQRMSAPIDDLLPAPANDVTTPQKSSNETDAHSIERLESDPANSTPSSSGSKASRRLSISDRIAALKNASEGSATPISPAEHHDETPETPISAKDQPRKTLISDRIAAMKNTPVHKPSEADKYLSPSNTSTSDLSEPRSPPALPVRLMPDTGEEVPSMVEAGASNSKPQPSNKPLSIAERIAAMKANAAAKAEAESTETPVPPPVESSRKAGNNMKELGAKIILPGMGGPRPMFPMKPPHTPTSSETEVSTSSGGKKSSSSVDESGEFQHLSLSRPSIAGDKRKKTSSTRMRKNWQDSLDSTDLTQLTLTTSTTPNVTLESISDVPVEND